MTTLLPGIEAVPPKATKKTGNLSGQIFERQVQQLLEECGWTTEKQYQCGYRLAKLTKFRVDLKASKYDMDIIVSCKYQDVPGTAGDKLPYEYMCMLQAVETNLMSRGFIVLQGWEAERSNMFSGPKSIELEKYMTISRKVLVLGFTEFHRMAVRNELLKGVPK